MKRVSSTALLIIFSLLWQSEVMGRNFPSAITLSDTRMTKSGETTYRFFGIFKAFDAVLYLEDGYEADAYPGDFHFCLSLTYHRPFKREQLIDSAQKILKDIHSENILDSIEERVENINEAYANVVQGDSYSLYYAPGKGTQLLLNGEPQALIEGFDFAESYFAIWLGGHPTTNKLRKALLKRS